MSKGNAMGGHHSASAGSVDWFTEQWIIDALGGAESFDLDPCTSLLAPNKTARAIITREENALIRRWDGRCFVNPPYTNKDLHLFMRRLAQHGQGTALIFARTETKAFFETVWRAADSVLFIEGRLHFLYPDGTRAPANAGAPSVLVGYGRRDSDILAAAAAGAIPGQFQALRLPRSVVVSMLEPSWLELVGGWLREQRGPVRLDDLYRAISEHPKVRGRRHWQAKVRQTLQRGGFKRVGRAEWAA